MKDHLYKQVYELIEVRDHEKLVTLLHDLEAEFLIFSEGDISQNEIYSGLILLHLIKFDYTSINNLKERMPNFQKEKCLNILLIISESLIYKKYNQVLPSILQYSESSIIVEYNGTQPINEKNCFMEWPNDLLPLLEWFIIEFENKIVKSLSTLYDKLSLNSTCAILGLSIAFCEEMLLKFGWVKENINSEVYWITKYQLSDERTSFEVKQNYEEEDFVLPMDQIFHYAKALDLLES